MVRCSFSVPATTTTPTHSLAVQRFPACLTLRQPTTTAATISTTAIHTQKSILRFSYTSVRILKPGRSGRLRVALDCNARIHHLFSASHFMHADPADPVNWPQSLTLIASLKTPSLFFISQHLQFFLHMRSEMLPDCDRGVIGHFV